MSINHDGALNSIPSFYLKHSDCKSTIDPHIHNFEIAEIDAICFETIFMGSEYIVRKFLENILKICPEFLKGRSSSCIIVE